MDVITTVPFMHLVTSAAYIDFQKAQTWDKVLQAMHLFGRIERFETCLF